MRKGEAFEINLSLKSEMLRFITLNGLLLVLCLLQITLSGPQVMGQRKQPSIPVATLFDEYGRIGGCDQGARLDNLVISVQNDPTLDAYVLAYGPEGEIWGSGRSQLNLIKDYLVNSRGLPEGRVKMIYGGRNLDLKEPKIELWLAPHGAAPPEPQHFETSIETFKGKFAEQEGWDSFYLNLEGEAPGPPVGDVTLASLADMLTQQKHSQAYVVAYNGRDAVPGAWRRVAERRVEALKQAGVNSERIQIVYGGSMKDTTVQFWVLPQNAPPPVKDAGPEPLPQKAVQMGIFTDYELASLENQQTAVNELIKVLRLDEKLRVCMIVRLESPVAHDEEGPVNELQTAGLGTSAPNQEQPVEEPAGLINQPADIPTLIQKWTIDLAAKKIPSDRIAILFVPSREFETSLVEMWIVPAGLPLPDPFAEEPEQPEEPAEAKPQNPQKPQQNKPSI